MSVPPLLSLHGISKRYGLVQANDGIDLVVEAGSIHAILGENGAGKSTLMKLISAVEQPDAGEIAWNGTPVALSRASEAQSLGIGMVFQHFSLFEGLSVVQNVSLIVPGTKAELAQRIQAMGENFGLVVDPEAMVHRLSVGERQRVEIIRCLLREPKLLILDEPTSVLPPQSVTKLFETLRRLRDGGMAILFISHKLGEIQALCDTATILRGGRVTGRVDPRVHTAAELATLMIGHEMPEPAPAAPRVPGKIALTLDTVSYANPDPFGTSIDRLSLNLRAGQILGIAGISGNGQQELAALISGEIRGSDVSGSIEIIGQSALSLGAAARRRLGLAFVPEDRLGRGAVPEMSLTENALLTAHRQGLVRNGFLSRRAMRNFTLRCIAEHDVRTPGPETEAGALSGGNLQKFIMGREMALNPKVLLVAQPTWGVDVGAAAAIRTRLVELRNQGVAILVISEELEELFEICDTLQVLHKGHLSPVLVTSDTTASEVGTWMIGAGA